MSPWTAGIRRLLAAAKSALADKKSSATDPH
jgi:hypothetical protein